MTSVFRMKGIGLILDLSPKDPRIAIMIYVLCSLNPLHETEQPYQRNLFLAYQS